MVFMMVIRETDIEGLSLGLLRALGALVEERSVTRAADRLGLSQPAMSAQLRRLREIFDDPILTRVPGGSAPTPRATALAKSVADILSRVRELVEPAPAKLNPKSLRTQITVIATDYVQYLVVTALMKRLQAEAPFIHLDIRHADRTRAREWLEQGEVDLGIGPGTVPTGKLHFRRLYRDRAVCIFGRRHFPEPEPLTIEEFCALPHVRVVPRRSSFYDDVLDRALDRRGLERRVVLTLQEFLPVREVVRGCGMVATLPGRLFESMESARDLWVRPPPLELPEMAIGMYWHERTHQSAVHRWFRSLVLGALRPLGE